MIMSSVLYQAVNWFSYAGENENEGHAEKSIQCGLENLYLAQAQTTVYGDYCYVLRGRDDLVCPHFSRAGYPTLKTLYHGLPVRW